MATETGCRAWARGVNLLHQLLELIGGRELGRDEIRIFAEVRLAEWDVDEGPDLHAI